jgi:hypothetical protein
MEISELRQASSIETGKQTDREGERERKNMWNSK